MGLLGCNPIENQEAPKIILNSEGTHNLASFPASSPVDLYPDMSCLLSQRGQFVVHSPVCLWAFAYAISLGETDISKANVPKVVSLWFPEI